MASCETGRASLEGAARKTVQLDGSNTSENNQSPRELQARTLTRRCAITYAMAMILAPLAFGSEDGA